MKAIRFDTPAAAKAFRKLPTDAQSALRAKLDAYAAEAHAGRVKALKGREGVRLRAGDYRVIVDDTATELRIIAVGNRRDIYR